MRFAGLEQTPDILFSVEVPYVWGLSQNQQGRWNSVGNYNDAFRSISTTPLPYARLAVYESSAAVDGLNRIDAVAVMTLLMWVPARYGFAVTASKPFGCTAYSNPGYDSLKRMVWRTVDELNLPIHLIPGCTVPSGKSVPSYMGTYNGQYAVGRDGYPCAAVFAPRSNGYLLECRMPAGCHVDVYSASALSISPLVFDSKHAPLVSQFDCTLPVNPNSYIFNKAEALKHAPAVMSSYTTTVGLDKVETAIRYRLASEGPAVPLRQYTIADTMLIPNNGQPTFTGEVVNPAFYFYSGNHISTLYDNGYSVVGDSYVRNWHLQRDVAVDDYLTTRTAVNPSSGAIEQCWKLKPSPLPFLSGSHLDGNPPSSIFGKGNIAPYLAPQFARFKDGGSFMAGIIRGADVQEVNLTDPVTKYWELGQYDRYDSSSIPVVTLRGSISRDAANALWNGIELIPPSNAIWQDKFIPSAT